MSIRRWNVRHVCLVDEVYLRFHFNRLFSKACWYFHFSHTSNTFPAHCSDLFIFRSSSFRPCVVFNFLIDFQKNEKKNFQTLFHIKNFCLKNIFLSSLGITNDEASKGYFCLKIKGFSFVWKQTDRFQFRELEQHLDSGNI